MYERIINAFNHIMQTRRDVTKKYNLRPLQEGDWAPAQPPILPVNVDIFLKK